MSSIQTTHVVPADLNAILYHAEMTLHRFGETGMLGPVLCLCRLSPSAP